MLKNYGAEHFISCLSTMYSGLYCKWKAYQGILPSKRHRITEKGKGSGETDHLERFNNTLRQLILNP